MASKKKPPPAPEPQDDSVYRVKHISRSAWESGTLNLPGLQPKQQDNTLDLDDIAMDMAMTGEIPLELIRSMLQRQEREQQEAAQKTADRSVRGMIRPEDIVPKDASEAEMADELPTPEEIETAKEEMRSMRAKSRLPQQEKPAKPAKPPKPPKAPKEAKPKPPKEAAAPKPKKAKPEPIAKAPEPERAAPAPIPKAQKPERRKPEPIAKAPKKPKRSEIVPDLPETAAPEIPPEPPKPVLLKKERAPKAEKAKKPAQQRAKEEQPVRKEQPAEPTEQKGGLRSLLHTWDLFALSQEQEEARSNFWADDVPLYEIPVGHMLEFIYRALYYYGLRFVRPLRIAGRYLLPHLLRPLVILWHLMRAAALSLHHITIRRMRLEIEAGHTLHKQRLAARKQPVKFKEAAFDLVKDYQIFLRPLANSLLPLAALGILLIVTNSAGNITYALNVDYYGNNLGYIANESVFLQAQAAANRHIKPLPETLSEDAPATAGEEAADAEAPAYAQFSIARVQPEQLTSVDMLTDQLLDNSQQEMTSACGIYISDENGKNSTLFATIKNSTDATSVLNSIKSEKGANLQTSETADIGFVQTVDLVQGFYPTDQLVDAQTLLAMLTAPKQESINVTLTDTDTISGITSKYGISRKLLYEINPGLAERDTKLRGGDVLLVQAEVPILQVKVVQTEVRKEEVSYDIIDRDNYNLYKGEVRIRVTGVPGIKTITERVTYVNGVRSGSPEIISSVVTKEPVNEQRDVGRKSTKVSLPGGGSITINPSASGFTWPVPDCTRVSSPYGYRRSGFHKGIDIADGKTNGKIIVAAKGGTVELVQLGGSSYGNQVVINHGNGVKTRYAHMLSGSVSVRQGESVSIGQPIGRVGSTGNSTGPHLHFEVIINGSTQNPLNYVKRP